ncbi:hypothetical protein [Rhizobium laguerreae]|uniref:hypothetical protein n=1 Tax=Rhizobium laguerreae TaxID=1076926 RepID=UPI001FE64E31|nr:hypothetical protein [Rhizobium laguerreae]
MLGRTTPAIAHQLIGTRTRLINQMRAFCLEYGIALRQGAGLFKVDMPQVLEDHSNELSSAMRKLLAELFTDLRRLEERIGDVTREIEAIARVRLHFSQPLETVDNSRKPAIWLRCSA